VGSSGCWWPSSLQSWPSAPNPFVSLRVQKRTAITARCNLRLEPVWAFCFCVFLCLLFACGVCRSFSHFSPSIISFNCVSSVSPGIIHHFRFPFPDSSRFLIQLVYHHHSPFIIIRLSSVIRHVSACGHALTPHHSPTLPSPTASPALDQLVCGMDTKES
jgi:hypothetical protein